MKIRLARKIVNCGDTLLILRNKRNKKWWIRIRHYFSNREPLKDHRITKALTVLRRKGEIWEKVLEVNKSF